MNTFNRIAAWKELSDSWGMNTCGGREAPMKMAHAECIKICGELIQFDNSPASAVELVALWVWRFICPWIALATMFIVWKFRNCSPGSMQLLADIQPYLDQLHLRKWLVSYFYSYWNTFNFLSLFFYKVYVFVHVFAIIKYKLHQASIMYNL